MAMYALSAFFQVAAFGIFGFLYLSGRSALLRAYLFFLLVNLFQAMCSLLGLYAFGLLGAERAGVLMPWFRFPSLVALSGLAVAAPGFFVALADSSYPSGMRLLFRSLAIAVILIAPLSFLPATAGARGSRGFPGRRGAGDRGLLSLWRPVHAGRLDSLECRELRLGPAVPRPPFPAR